MAERKRHSITLKSFQRSRRALARFSRQQVARGHALNVWAAGIEWASGWIAKYLSSLRLIPTPFGADCNLQIVLVSEPGDYREVVRTHAIRL